MFNALKRLTLLICACSLVLSQDISPPDTSALDTNAIFIEWKHKTLTQNMIKFGATAMLLPILSLGEDFDESVYSKMVIGGSAIGFCYGMKTIKEGKDAKIRTIRNRVFPEKRQLKTNKIIDPASCLLSMAWRSIVGFYAGSLVGVSLDLISKGLLPDQNKNIEHVLIGTVAGGIYGFYKGLENSNKKYGLPVGSPFKSILFAAITNYALEYSFYHTINKKPPPEKTQFLISFSIYFGYNYDHWKKIFSKN
jgi:hypothetical protein